MKCVEESSKLSGHMVSSVKKKEIEVVWHVSGSSGLANTLLLTACTGTVQAVSSRGRHRKRWADNISEWTVLTLSDTARTDSRQGWRRQVAKLVW